MLVISLIQQAQCFYMEMFNLGHSQCELHAPRLILLGSEQSSKPFNGHKLVAIGEQPKAKAGLSKLPFW